MGIETLNFYALQLILQVVLASWWEVMRIKPRHCSTLVEHPKGIQLGYSFSWLIARVMSFYAAYVVTSAFLLVATGVLYRFKVQAGDDEETNHKEIYQEMNDFIKDAANHDRRELTKRLCMLVVRVGRKYAQGAWIIVTQWRKRDDGLARRCSFASRNELCERTRLVLSLVPVSLGIHTDRWATTAFEYVQRCEVWRADVENEQLATAKVLSLVMQPVPCFGMVAGKFIEYSNESSAWVWTNDREFCSKYSRYKYDEDDAVLTKWVSHAKCNEYIKWTQTFPLGILLFIVSIAPSKSIFIGAFIHIVVVQSVDLATQVKEPLEEYRRKRRESRVAPKELSVVPGLN